MLKSSLTMDDDNGIELSLGLSCGGSSGKSKVPDASLYPRAEEGNCGRIATDATVSFKKFLQTTIKGQNQNGSREMEPVMLRPSEDVWTNHGNTSNAAHCNISQLSIQRELCASDGKTVETEDSCKRKMPLEDVNVPKRLKQGVDLVDSLGKSPVAITSVKNSRISATTEDGSCGENEEVAESEAEGSNSWSISQREDNTKNSDTSRITGKHVIDDGKPASLSGIESNHEVGKLAYGVPFSAQPMGDMTIPYSVPKLPATASILNATGPSSPFFKHMEAAGKNEHPIIQGANSDNIQLTFGYSKSQLPTLETGSSWAFGSRLQRLASSADRAYPDGPLNSEHPGKAPAWEAQATQWDFSKGRQTCAGDPSTSSLFKAEHEGKANDAEGKPKESTNQAILKTLHPEASTIRPGVAPDIKFGGCGSYPDLPWVTTTGSGPNGKSISGVTYKYSKDQIKIVCACHGLHMTPEEFIQHADAETTDQENTAILTSLAAGKPAASARS